MKYFIGLLIFLLVFFAGETLISDSSAKPNEKTAAIELFGNDCCTKKTEYGKDDFEILETQEFVFADKQHLSFFFAAKSYDKAGNLIDCHQCGSKIAVITYSFNGARWSLIDKNLKLTVSGSYGFPPNFGFYSLKISDGLFGILIPDSDLHMGITSSFEYLLTFNGKKWSASGVLMTGRDNSGDCGSGSRFTCYEWTGEIAVLRETNQIYPDIAIKRNGTDYVGDSNEVSFLKDEIYRFDGESYKLTTAKYGLPLLS